MSKLIGKIGEDLACEILDEKGFEIIERNFLTRFGEIDVIAKDGQTLVFVEVKYRKDEGFGTAAEFVTKEKLKKILKTAEMYINEKDLCEIDYRIDALAIDGSTGEYELIQNIFVEGL
jgi:putative endonuclease